MPRAALCAASLWAAAALAAAQPPHPGHPDLAEAERVRAARLRDLLEPVRRHLVKGMRPADREEERRLDEKLESLAAGIAEARAQADGDPARVDRLRRAADAVREERRRLLERVYRDAPRLRLWRGEEPPLQGADLLAAVGPGAAALHYRLAGDRLILLVADGRAAAHGHPEPAVSEHVVDIDGEELAAAVRRLRREAADPDAGWRRSARELHRLLVEPVRRQLQGVETLIVVPDGILWQVPFEVLEDADGRALIDDHRIAYAASLTALARARHLRDLRRPAVAAASPTLLAIADPEPDASAVARLRAAHPDAPLDQPAAGAEAGALAAIYTPARALVHTGAEASEARVRREALDYSRLHIGARGILDVAAPFESALLLAPGRSGDDGVLTAGEMLGLEWRAELVAFAGFDLPPDTDRLGDGLTALSWAVFVAGSPALIVSRWTARDDLDFSLMAELHRRLGGPSRPVPLGEALRQAALVVRQTPGREHPFYWAGLMLLGDGR